MCGIAGTVDIDGGSSHPRVEGISRMLGGGRHRGPEDVGIYLDEAVALGSARLSIVDTVHGRQPLRNEDGTLWIICNGEIFNYVELRTELEQRGHRFSTKT